MKKTDCTGGPDCPLGIPHPPASLNPIKAMYPLGCSLCRKTNHIIEDAEAQGAVEEIDLDEDDAPGYIWNADYQYYNPLNENV